jgi:hypothetical protein
MKKEPKKSEPRKSELTSDNDFWMIPVSLLMLMLILVLVGLLFTWPLLIGPVSCQESCKEVAADPFSRALLLPLALLIGYILYRVRKSFRRLYGFSEVIAGLFACWVGLGQIQSALRFSPGAEDPGYPFSFRIGVALAGGIYIIVRGLDNYGKGQQEKKRAS